jgi:hypothetical protein
MARQKGIIKLKGTLVIYLKTKDGHLAHVRKGGIRQVELRTIQRFSERRRRMVLNLVGSREGGKTLRTALRTLL